MRVDDADGPDPRPRGPRGFTRTDAAFAALLAVVLLTAFVPVGPDVVDLATGEPVAGARLEPIDATFRAVTEPVLGPILFLVGLPLLRLLSWLLWIAGTIAVLRIRRALRAGRGRRGVLAELAFFVGRLPPIAAVPVALYWSDLLDKDAMKRALLVGLPCAAVVFAVLAWRKSSRGGRTRALLACGARCLGVLGMTLGAASLVAFDVVPGLKRDAYRLVPPRGYVVGDLHAHVHESDGDARETTPELLDFDARHGISVAAITPHNEFAGPGTSGRRVVDETLRARGLDMLVLPGQEFTTHVLHLVILGTHRTFQPRDYRRPDWDAKQFTPPDYGFDFARLVRDVHAEGGRVVVAHWWMIWTWYKVDWRLLADWGVDGFEVGSSTDAASPGLVRQWRDRGLFLDAGSDNHGTHKALYSWDLIDLAAIDPKGLPLAKLDPYDVVEQLFKPGALRAVGMMSHHEFDPAVPAALEPPAGLWRYFTRLRMSGRISWAAYALLLWAAVRFVRRRARSAA